MAVTETGGGTAIPKGHQCSSVEDFVELLRWWLEGTDEDTVGDCKNFAGKPWVRVTIGGVPCHLNADTRRTAVERFVGTVADDGAATFSVAANAKGPGHNVNKVVVGRSEQAWKYFYLYTDKVLESPREL